MGNFIGIQDNVNCLICNDPENDHIFAQGECGHWFHIKCVQQHFRDLYLKAVEDSENEHREISIDDNCLICGKHWDVKKIKAID